MPIGEIADRYSIAILKKQRADADNQDEITQFLNELNQYDGIFDYVEKLININGKIWDLESDLRKGKEGELGLEEVGRRAIQIREFNKIRVGYKNQIVDKYNEGFKDIKMNHASQDE